MAATRNNTIDYIELPTTDMAQSKAFYGAVFGWTFTDYGPGYAGFHDGPAAEREAGGLSLQDSVSRGGPLVVLWADELEAALERVQSAGGTVTQPIFDFPGGRRFEFQDPSGIDLAVWSVPTP